MSSQPQRPQIPPDMKAFNAKLIQEFRATGGKLSGPMEGRQLLLLTTTGSKSFAPRTVVVGYRSYGDRYAIIASDNGAPKSPHWFANLQTSPVANVEVGAENFQVKARVADPAERTELAKLIEYLDQQQKLTSREIPIVVLEKI